MSTREGSGNGQSKVEEGADDEGSVGIVNMILDRMSVHTDTNSKGEY